MKAVHLFLVLLFMGVAVGCGTIYGVQTDYDKRVDFEGLKTYDWMTVPEKAGINSPIFERVKQEVNAELQAKGLTMTSNHPDFLIAQYLGKKAKEQILNLGYGYNPHGFLAGGGRTAAYKYEEGSLLLDFVNAKSNEIIWRGEVKAEIDFANTPKKIEKLIHEAVQKLLRKFPPKPEE